MSVGSWAWRADKPASIVDLARLEATSPKPLPPAYLDLLRESDGLEAGLAVQPLWLVIYPAQEVVEIATSGAFRDAFPDLFVFGGNGGGEAFAFDYRPNRNGEIVAFDTTNIDLGQSVIEVAATFDDLLTQIDT